jgi:hypothetical protein
MHTNSTLIMPNSPTTSKTASKTRSRRSKEPPNTDASAPGSAHYGPLREEISPQADLRTMSNESNSVNPDLTLEVRGKFNESNSADNGGNTSPVRSPIHNSLIHNSADNHSISPLTTRPESPTSPAHLTQDQWNSTGAVPRSSAPNKRGLPIHNRNPAGYRNIGKTEVHSSFWNGGKVQPMDIMEADHDEYSDALSKKSQNDNQSLSIIDRLRILWYDFCESTLIIRIYLFIAGLLWVASFGNKTWEWSFLLTMSGMVRGRKLIWYELHII